eukprot:8845514-Lingulodinium_polyedra.AAC.1
MAASRPRAAASVAATRVSKTAKTGTQPHDAEADMSGFADLVEHGMMVEVPEPKASRNAVVVPLPDGRACVLCDAKDTDDDEFDSSR